MLLKEKNLDNNPKGFNDILNKVKNKEDFFIKTFIANCSTNQNVLYIHIPFCTSKCKYCNCGSKQKSNDEEVNKFIKYVLIEQIERYKEVFDQVIFDQVYFGGGTPTIIDAKTLEDLFNLIPNFAQIKIKCIESSPHTLTCEHIDLFKKYDFNFLSVGIQSIDEKICLKYNRQGLSKNEFLTLSSNLKESNLYFNYDIICFLDKGDIRDLVKFKNDLIFIMKYANPSCITIHQLYQSNYSIDKTRLLIDTIKECLQIAPEYKCVNSLLKSDDALLDCMYQAEYKLSKENFNFKHYMWNKYASIPVFGYNILSIGYTEKFNTVSNIGNIALYCGKNELKYITFDENLIKMSKLINASMEQGVEINDIKN